MLSGLLLVTQQPIYANPPHSDSYNEILLKALDSWVDQLIDMAIDLCFILAPEEQDQCLRKFYGDIPPESKEKFLQKLNLRYQHKK